MTFEHPITHTEDIRTLQDIANSELPHHQYYAVPANCVDGDNVGKVNFLWSHQKFYNRRFGANLTDASYSFEIVYQNVDNAFSISSTGELIIEDASLFTSTRLLTVKISVSADYWEETLCKVERVPVADCVFFDSSVTGANGSGTRSDPYRGWGNHFYGGDLITYGTPGKHYFWKRGQTHADWTKTRNPLIDGERPPYITLGAYGAGDRPIINGSTLANHERFCDISDSSLYGTNETGIESPEKVAYNVRIMDIETTCDDTASWYPYQIGMYGKGCRFYRLKCSNLSTWEDGFFWARNSPGLPGTGKIEAIFQDIETYNSKYRAIKLEGGEVVGRNFYCETQLDDTETPLSAANAPNVDLKYGVQIVKDNQRGLGMQIRAENHNYEWFYLKGYRDAMNPYKHSAHNGLDDTFRPKNSHFKNIIIDGCTASICGFVSGGGNRNPQNIKFINIDVVNSPGAIGGLNVNQGAEGTVIEMCNLGDSAGVKIAADTVGTEIRNCTVPGSIDRVGNATITNSVYGSLTGVGTGTITTSLTPLLSAYFRDMAGKVYKPVEGSALLGAGTDLSLSLDLDGNLVLDIPAIGCYELEIGDVEKYSISLSVYPLGSGSVTEITTGPYAEGDSFEIIAVSNVGKRFINWEIYGSSFYFEPYYVGTMGTENLPLTALFEDDPNYVPAMTPRGIRFVSLVERYGNAVYDAYTRAKVNNGIHEVPLMDMKYLSDRLLRHDWDMANVPFCYKDNALYSLVGPDLIVAGGEHGSRINRAGLLVTELPADRPRFDFDPVTGVFGVYVEVGDTNVFPDSNDFMTDWRRSNLTFTIENIIKSPDGSLNANKIVSTNGGYSFYPSIAQTPKYLSLFIRAIDLPGEIQSLKYNTYTSGLFNVAQVWKRISILSIPYDTGGTNIYTIDLRGVGSTLIQGLFYGLQVSSFDTSYIKTTGSTVTRPADTYSAPSLINISTPYSILERRNGECILKYVEPGSGTMKTYKDGAYIGSEAFTPVTDYVAGSEGSDKVSAFAYKSGILTESERMERSIL